MDKSSPGTDFRFNAPESEAPALIKTSNYPGHSIICGNLRRRRRSRLQKSSCPFKTGHPERWPSGLRRTLGKRVCGKPYRGFESHSLRHLHDFVRQPTILDYFVRDCVAVGPRRLCGHNNAGIDTRTVVAQAQIATVRSVRPDTLGFRRHLEKVAAALSV